MWIISGIDKTTLRRVRIAIADNICELRMILRQEREEKKFEKVEAVRVWN